MVYTEIPPFACRPSVLSQPFIVKTVFFYVINKLCMWFVHVCAQVCLCVTMSCMHEWRPESHIRCLPFNIHHHAFLRQGLPQNLEITFWAGLTGQQAPGASLPLAPSTGSQVCIHTWHLFTQILEIWSLVFTLAHQLPTETHIQHPLFINHVGVFIKNSFTTFVKCSFPNQVLLYGYTCMFLCQDYTGFLLWT